MMPDEPKTEPVTDQAKIFQIRIRGHLSQQWTDWFEGLTITLEEDGNTLISGPVVDQSALHGILKRIRDLGMPLLSVNPVDDQPTHTVQNEDSTIHGES